MPLDFAEVEFNSGDGELIVNRQRGGVTDTQPESVVRLFDEVDAVRVGIERCGCYPFEFDAVSSNCQSAVISPVSRC